MIKLLKSNWKLFLIAALTIGLAPFSPPHIWEKLQWVAGGGAINGKIPMATTDWFDLFLHGTPWLLLLISAILNGSHFIKTKL